MEVIETPLSGELSLLEPEWRTDGTRAATLVTSKQQGSAGMNDGATGAT